MNLLKNEQPFLGDNIGNMYSRYFGTNKPKTDNIFVDTLFKTQSDPIKEHLNI